MASGPNLKDKIRLSALLIAITFFAVIGIGSAVILGPKNQITEDIEVIEEDLLEMEIGVVPHPIAHHGPNK